MKKTINFLFIISALMATPIMAQNGRPFYKPLTKEERSPHIKETDIKAQCPYKVSSVDVYWIFNGDRYGFIPNVGTYGPPVEKDDHAEWWPADYDEKGNPTPPLFVKCFGDDEQEFVVVPIPRGVRFCYMDKGDPKRPDADIRRFWCR